MTSLVVEADGGSRGNPGPAAYGAVVRDATTGAILAELAQYIGTATNNVAEYRGLIAALEHAREIDPDAVVEARLDSKLVVEQMSGRWKIKHENMRELALRARAIFPAGRVSYRWVPREANGAADALVNEVLDAALAGDDGIVARISGVPVPDTGAQDVVGEAEEERARAIIAERPRNRMIGWTDLGPPVTTVCVRHGATQYSLDKRFSGSGGEDIPLAAIGELQAKAVALELRERGGADVIVSSPLLRTRQTAAAICEAIGTHVEIEDDLRECSFGEWDGLTFAQVQEGWGGFVDEWLASTAVAPPGGESFEACSARVDAARRRIIDRHRGKKVVVVAHVTPIKLLVATAVGAPLQSLYRMELNPCSLTTLAWFPDGNASMFAFSETAHLRQVPSPHGT